MLSVINISQESQWLEWLGYFPATDVYYLPAYSRVCCENGEGQPYAACYENQDGKVFYPFLEREIRLPWLEENTEFEGYLDITTPYGYGGPIIACQDDRRDKLTEDFREEFNDYCRKKKIVSEFIRFHPLLNNHVGHHKHVQAQLNRYTVAIDLQGGPDKIWREMTRECRNRIKKGQTNGLQVDYSTKERDLQEFIKLYKQTMEKVQARQYYYFNEKYFSGLKSMLNKNFLLVNVRLGGTVIASSIFLCHDPIISYHLNGSDPNYLTLAPNELLIYKAACYGADNGFKFLHLGGGYSQNCSLFRFKKKFAPNGIREFWTGKKIHLIDVYQELESQWRLKNDNLHENPDFFPVYRG